MELVTDLAIGLEYNQFSKDQLITVQAFGSCSLNGGIKNI